MEFYYKAKNQKGDLREGNIEAPNEIVAVDTLHDKGFVVLSLAPTQKGLFNIDIKHILGRPKSKDIVAFTRQLATLIEADMPITEGLRTLAKQVEKEAFRKVIAEIYDSVEGGSALSAALGDHPELFSSFYIKLVRSGELSGKLQNSLNYLADYLERTQAINSKIKGALSYPAFVIFSMIVVAMIMVVYVLPQLLSIFKEAGNVELPISTKALIFLTGFINNHLGIILGVLILAPAIFSRYIHTSKGEAWVDDLKLQIPIFGRILKNLYLARMAESLATLIRADIAILDSIKITSELVGNHIYRTVLLDAEENVRGGGSLSDAFGKFKDIPALVTSMVAVGEKTGKLEAMLNHVAKFFRTESEEDLDNLSALIEPVMVLILGLGVAILVSSVLLPIYNLTAVS